MKSLIILLFVAGAALMVTGASGFFYNRGERLRLEDENERDREELRKLRG